MALSPSTPPSSTYPANGKAPLFDLVHIPVDGQTLRSYFHQATNAGFGFSIEIGIEVAKYGKPSAELSLQEIESVLSGVNLWIPDSVYRFMGGPETLFTDIQEVSFEQGGLIVMQLFGLQIYQLHLPDGRAISGHCHDLELLHDGKYIYRSSGDAAPFRLAQYDFSTRSVTEYGVTHDAYNRHIRLLNRDRYAPGTGTSVPIRIENFAKPASEEDAVRILKDPATDWLTSPELVFFYARNKDLAAMAVRRCPMAYSLIADDFKNDPHIVRILLIESELNAPGVLDAFIWTFGIPVEEYLSGSEIIQLLESGRINCE